MCTFVQLSTLGDFDWFEGLDSSILGNILDLLNNVVALYHLTKDYVLSI